MKSCTIALYWFYDVAIGLVATASYFRSFGAIGSGAGRGTKPAPAPLTDCLIKPLSMQAKERAGEMRIQAEYLLKISWLQNDSTHRLQMGPTSFERLLVELAKAAKHGRLSRRDAIGISEGLRRLMRRELRLKTERFSTGGKAIELIEQQDTLTAMLRARGMRSFQI